MTVASEMNSRAAAPRLVSPWAISVQHLELAVAQRILERLRSWLTSRVATDGASTDSPRCAARTARTSSHAGASFSR